MFYSASFTDKYSKEQATEIKNNLSTQLEGIIAVDRNSNRHDLTLTLPTAQTVFCSVMLSDEPWVDLKVPCKIFQAAHLPHLIWFAETDGEGVTNIQSIKTNLFKFLACGPTKPLVRNETHDFKVSFSLEGNYYAKISTLNQISGFSIDPVKSYLIEQESLLDENVGFGYYEFSPKLLNVDDAFWFFVHLMNSVQANNLYSTLWPKYQQFLSR